MHLPRASLPSPYDRCPHVDLPLVVFPGNIQLGAVKQTGLGLSPGIASVGGAFPWLASVKQVSLPSPYLLIQ